MTELKIEGRCWVYGDDVNTDVIFPGKYTYNLPPSEFAKHALEDLDPEFAKAARPGDVIVGGKNFGCGSSREQAAVCIKMSGVTVIIACSFARIFFRNCVNNGVLPIVCPEAVDHLQKGDAVEVDLARNLISLKTEDGGQKTDWNAARLPSPVSRQFSFPPLSPSVMDIINAGGLIPMLRRKLGMEHLPMPEIKFAGEG
jgi:3-isopropylmalate/(R)-2-methylmalate dehydratase small subunit